MKRALQLFLMVWWGGFALRYALDAGSYGAVLGATGVVSAWLLVAALAASMPWVRRRAAVLMRLRRTLGVGMFAFAALHAGVFLHRKGFADSLEPELWTGWAALLLAVPLTVTSTDRAVRAMGPRWRRLHRLAWVVAGLTGVHWVQTAFDPLVGYIFSGVVVVMLALRLKPQGV